MAMKIEKFEDIEAWQMGRELTKLLYQFTRKEPVARDYGFIDQIRRASVSIMNNIAEGYERGSNKDFVRFLFIARGSVGEVRSLLYVASDQGYISENEFKEWHLLCRRISAAIWGFIKSLRKKSSWIEAAHITMLLVAFRIGLVVTRTS